MIYLLPILSIAAILFVLRRASLARRKKNQYRDYLSGKDPLDPRD